MAIIIDAAAGTVRPDDADVRVWMADQRVFISSVMAGMIDLRQAVADAISEAGAEPVYFETFGGRNDDAEAAYLGEVAASTIYLGVLGQSYGRLQPSRLSATHEEFREADRLNLSVSAWVQRGVDLDGDQLKFLDEVRLFHTTGSYQSADDLSASAVRRLNEIVAADLSPWVLLGGESMFRARSIRDDGKKITIEATIRNPALGSALENLRPTTWSRKEVRLTFNGRSKMVSVKSVHTATSSRTATSFTIECESAVDTDVRTPLLSINVAGRTFGAAEVGETLIRRALFGENVPSGILSLGGRVDPPLTQMPPDVVSDDLQRAVMRLLITEALIRSGRVSRVLRLDISPIGADGRLADITWEAVGARPGDAPRHIRGRLK